MKWWLIGTVVIFASCQKEIVVAPQPDSLPLSLFESYSNHLSEDSTIALTARLAWLDKGYDILDDTAYIRPPYHEQIRTDFGMYSVRFKGTLGEQATFSTSESRVLVDLWYDDSVSVKPVFQPIEMKDFYTFPLDASGDYVLRYMPKIDDTISQGWLTIELSPQNIMPVEGADNEDAWSRFGDPRDGGRRIHEGVDIFKRRGTPVIAASDGTVMDVSNKGLGGKQVWVKDARLPIAHYYAHLDSQYVQEESFVTQGDTLGTVGNTGNARTTRPHLHYGMYMADVGAVDPFPFIGMQRKIRRYRKYHDELPTSISFRLPWRLRQGPSSRFAIIKEGDANEDLTVIGWTNGWWHVSHQEQIGFVYEDHGLMVGL